MLTILLVYFENKLVSKRSVIPVRYNNKIMNKDLVNGLRAGGKAISFSLHPNQCLFAFALFVITILTVVK